MKETSVVMLVILHCFTTVGFIYLMTEIFPHLLFNQTAVLILSFGFFFGITILTIYLSDLLTKVEEIAKHSK